ncbi:MAG: hypothetical protein JOZ29_21245 [Deltaproteobacteria bacterium]|nr:hypothetical protein [Deltaproteobacteria bacterium]
MSHCQNWIEVAVAVWGLAIAALSVGFVIAGVTQSARGKNMQDSSLVPVLMGLWIVCAVGAVSFSILKPIGFLPNKSCGLITLSDATGFGEARLS